MSTPSLHFLLDKNLELPVTEKPLSDILSDAGIEASATTDLVHIDNVLSADGPDLAYVPGADFCVMLKKGNPHYKAIAIATSKFSGLPAQKTLLVVRKDDSAKGIEDLEGSTYGYMNKSCSSSYFPPAILLHRVGKQLDKFFDLKEVAGWQARVDAVVAQSIRSTMILQDVWKMDKQNPVNAKVIAEYVPSPPAIFIVKKSLDSGVLQKLHDYLFTYQPEWTNVYGAFRPYCFADVQTFYHDLSGLTLS